MKQKIFNIITVGLCFVFTMMFMCGCSETRILEKNLVIYYTIDSTVYEFSQKVIVDVSRSSYYDDGLSIHISSYRPDESILSGNFDKIGYNDDVIFILMDDTYYSFDIANYDVSDGREGEYELVEMTTAEFIEKYPDYEDFDWDFSVSNAAKEK